MNLRNLREMALQAGRARQQPQTGYVHCHYRDLNAVPLTIPTLENFLFALALLQSKTAEQMTEAKELLEKLLHFHKEGFPVYLHEYPHCSDPLLCTKLLAPLYWIQKGFNTVLGESLRMQLTTVSKELLNESLTKEAPYHLALRTATAAVAFGHLYGDAALEERGEKLLQELQAQGKTPAWEMPDKVAHMLVGLQMVYSDISESPWSDFWDHLGKTWSSCIGAYVGAPLKIFQDGYEPQVTPYDLYMSYLSEVLPERLLRDTPVHLHAALIQPHEKKLPSDEEAKSVVRLLDEVRPANPSRGKGYIPWRLIWGTAARVHTLECQGGNLEKISEGKGGLLVELGPIPEPDNRQRNRELAFCLDNHPEAKITVNGQPATVFYPGDQLTIKSGELEIGMVVHLYEGAGEFVGHLSPGNRSSQLRTKGEGRFDAYDWQIALRTVRRQEPCTLHVEITVDGQPL